MLRCTNLKNKRTTLLFDSFLGLNTSRYGKEMLLIYILKFTNNSLLSILWYTLWDFSYAFNNDATLTHSLYRTLLL